MSPERNEPCPCGSGKKYKKCCGTPRTDIDPVTRNRDAAYIGELGRRRRQFCLDYTAWKKTALAGAEKLLRDDAAAQKLTISCRKGCAHCCILYVIASLQEAEAITWYLYQHEAVLQHFLSAYRDWRRSLGSFADKLPRLDEEIARNMAGKLSKEEQERFDIHINEYAGRKVPCPFLVDNACSIHEVRPFACAAVVAVTPPELCSWGASGMDQAKYLKIEVKLAGEMPYFARPRNPILFGSMPELVHLLLEQGYSFLAGIEGLEEFRRSIPGRRL